MSLNQWRRRASVSFTRPLSRLLERSRLHPDVLTYLGFLLSLLGSGLILAGAFYLAVLVLLLSALCDLLDGSLARLRGTASRWGALLDSTLDRLSDAAPLVALSAYFLRQGDDLGVLLAMAALITSGLVSYIKARGEGLGLTCEVGFFTRPERVAALLLGLLLGWLQLALAVIALLSLLTALQRFMHLRGQIRRG